MSYPRDLDDYSDEELVSELSRRHINRLVGKCDYCGRPSNKKARCGSGRHTLTAQDLCNLIADRF
jgi:hypothetical protein